MNEIQEAIASIEGAFPHGVLHTAVCPNAEVAESLLTPLSFVHKNGATIQTNPNTRVHTVSGPSYVAIFIGGQLSAAENLEVLKRARSLDVELKSTTTGGCETTSELSFIDATESFADETGRIAETMKFGDLWAVVFTASGRPTGVFAIRQLESTARRISHEINRRTDAKIQVAIGDRGIPGAGLEVVSKGQTVMLDWLSGQENIQPDQRQTPMHLIDVAALQASKPWKSRFPQALEEIGKTTASVPTSSEPVTPHTPKSEPDIKVPLWRRLFS